MGVETFANILSLNELWPLGSDSKSEGDDHLRGIKKVLKADFPKGGAGKTDATAQARNRIVNGAMQISQELGDTGSAVTGSYTVDQWAFGVAGITASAARNIASDGLPRIVIAVSTAKGSLAAGDTLNFSQRVEGTRIIDFLWGLATGKQAILRFDVNAAMAGTFSAAIRNGAANRSFLAPFTVPATTWTTVTVVVPPDTTGTWPSDTSYAMSLTLNFAGGTTTQGVAGWQAGNFTALATATNGASVTGGYSVRNVGLYLDPDNTGIAPKWTMPDEAQELAACMRYWQKQYTIWQGQVTSGTTVGGCPGYLPVQPRITTPAVSGVNVGASLFPVTVGSLAFNAPATTQESRTANGTGGGFYVTMVTTNARM